MLQPASIQKLDSKSRPVYRRDHRKADGRWLHLYGFAPHTGEPLEELLRNQLDESEIRFDPLRGTWAIYAPHRQNRTFQPSAAADPLAPARAGAVPTEIPFESFELAIFENRFASLMPEPAAPSVTGWANSPAVGTCEVVVYTSEADGSLATIGHDRRVLLIESLIDRYRQLYENGAAYVLPFENRGADVGVTLAHPHGQIYAFSETPEPQARAAAAFANGYDLIKAHGDTEGQLDVAGNAETVAFCPPFARFPYEVWIMPRTRCPGPWALDAGGVESVADLLGDVVRRLDALFAAPMPYMMSFQAAPRAAMEGPFQFTIQFFPMMRSPGRLKYLAGVEQFTGVFTVDVVPETAAERLRAL